MADESDQTEIIIESADEAGVTTEPTRTPPTESAAAAVETLKKQLADKDSETAVIRAEAERNREEAERNLRAATEAEHRARENAGHAQEQTRVAQSHELDSVMNAIGAVTTELGSLETKLAAAHEAGEFGTVAKLQTQIAKAGARLVHLEDGKSALEARAKEPVRQMPATDDREAYLARRTPPTAAWVRAHPQFFNDQNFRLKVESADGYVANVLGIARDTREYFTKIEEVVGLRQAAAPAPAAASAAAAVVDRTSDAKSHEEKVDIVVDTPSKPAAKPVPAAPPSRAVESNGTTTPTRVRLTKDEHEAAQWLFPKTKDDDPDPATVFARNKLRLMQEGVFGPDGRLLPRN